MNFKLITTKLLLGLAILLHCTQISAQEKIQQKPFTGAVNRNLNYKPQKMAIAKFNTTIATKANGTASPTTPNFVTDGVDVRVLPSANPQAEVHISINKTNPNNLIASCNSYPGNYHQAYFYSTNAGITWAGAEVLQNSPPVVWGDPSTAFDANGRGYITTMQENSAGYLCQSTTNGGVTWSNFVATNQSNFDKEMIAADNLSSSPFANNLYASWTNFSGGWTVEFNRSTNNGTSFSSPIILKNGWGQGTNVQTGVNGEVYVCWADYENQNEYPSKGLGFALSTNGGVSFN